MRAAAPVARFPQRRRVPVAKRAPAVRLAAAGCCTLFIGAAFVNVCAAADIRSASGPTFYLLMAAFSMYLLGECLLYLKRRDAFGLLAPPFLASIMHFYLSYILPAAGTAIDPWIFDRFAHYFASQPDQLADATLMLALAAFCMWRGYYLGQHAARKVQALLRERRALRHRLEPALPAIFALQVVYFGLAVYAVSVGLFGVAGTDAQRQQGADLLDFINTGLAGGSLSLLLLLIHVFCRRADGHRELFLAIACGVLVSLYTVAGAISGFKTQMVIPFIILALAKFVAERKLSITYIAACCLALFVAYKVVEPYREYLGKNSLSGTTSVSSLADALQNAYQQKEYSDENIPLSSQILSRFDLTLMTAIGINFAQNHTLVAAKSAEFAESFYLSPILAWVPRTFWPDKPQYHSGGWFNQVVLDHVEDTTTSVGMGPVTWSYMMGGIFGVVACFVGLGFVQALLFDGAARSGAGGFIVFLSGAKAMIDIPSDLGPAFVSVLRLLPIAFAAQYVLLRHLRFEGRRVDER